MKDFKLEKQAKNDCNLLNINYKYDINRNDSSYSHNNSSDY